MALVGDGEMLCHPVVREVGTQHPGVLRISLRVGMMACQKTSQLAGERPPKTLMVGATVMAVPMVPAQGTGESQRLRTMDPPAACGKVKEGMEEVVDGRKAPEEETEVVAGVSLLLL